MLLVAQPNLGAAEKRALCETIDSGWITMGPRVRAFEQAFAARHGSTDAVAVGSCTAALHLILAALGHWWRGRTGGAELDRPVSIPRSALMRRGT